MKPLIRHAPEPQWLQSWKLPMHNLPLVHCHAVGTNPWNENNKLFEHIW